MRYIKVTGLIAIMFLAASFQVAAQNWQIVPGRSVGPITQNTSESELIKIFGKANVKPVEVDVGEGEMRMGTALFPSDPSKKAFVLWNDPETRLRPESVTIRDANTLWQTDRGITIGTSLKTIERLNGRAFALTGFGWDYSGTVLHSNGGLLGELGAESGEEILGRTLLLRLSPSTSSQRMPEYRATLGDKKFLSSDSAMKKLNPVVYEMVIEFSNLGQSDVQIENELVAALKDIQTYTIYGGAYDEEKLNKAQGWFEEKLLKYTKIASTLNYNFSDLDELMSVATSEDRKLRIYSWDLQDGGTMHRFARVNQYQSADGKVDSRTDQIEEEGMGRGFVTDIFTLDTKDGKVYIVCSTVISSGKNYFQSADLYKIEGNTLNDKVKLFNTRSGLTNTLSFDYDNFSVIDQKEPLGKLISFDKKTKTLKIPVVIKDEEYPDGRVTDRFISYRFNGRYFVKVS